MKKYSNIWNQSRLKVKSAKLKIIVELILIF